MAKTANVTQLLHEYNQGDQQALEKLLPKIYEELKKQARRYMNKERKGHTLQPTALVHEAFMRLINSKEIEFQDRQHFFAVAANQMRRILIDHAKARHAQKRGGNSPKVSFDEKYHWKLESDVDLIALDEALEQLAQISEKQARIVELRYFGGLTVEETAAVMEVSPATIKRNWVAARAWLFRELQGTGDAE